MAQRLIDKHGIRTEYLIPPSSTYKSMIVLDFPKPIKVGRKSLWVVDEIEEWLAKQAAKREESNHA